MKKTLTRILLFVFLAIPLATAVADDGTPPPVCDPSVQKCTLS